MPNDLTENQQRAESSNSSDKPVEMNKINVQKDGAHLHNVNCWAYLFKLDLEQEQIDVLNALIAAQIILSANNRLTRLLSFLESYTINISDYDYTEHYGDIYTTLIEFIENNLTTIKQSPNLPAASYNNLILKLFLNNNDILKRTFDEISDIVLEHRLTDPEISHQISQHLANNQQYNQYAQTPAMAGSTLGRLQSIFSDNFKPQHSTSLPGFRTYNSSRAINYRPYTELRLGTQAQRHQGVERVSPLFEEFLQVQMQDLPESGISHVYFNNLGRDGDSFERNIERRLTDQLHQLEDRHTNIIVITLPSDKGFMSHGEMFRTRDSHSLSDTLREFMAIAMESPHSTSPIKDFHISARARSLIFKDEDQNAVLNELMQRSLVAMGLQSRDTLSSAERQALWFHFNKYELTNYILEKLKPRYFECSCKDGIDRGGVSSVYYNLIYAIKNGFPISRKDFECGLHAAPAHVKERGMNHHLDMIWNTVDCYIEANYEKIKVDPRQGWLLDWRDNSCPKGRVRELLQRRLTNGIAELKSSYLQRPKNYIAHSYGIRTLKQAQKLVDKKVSGKRMLLETTSAIIEHVLGRKHDKKKLEALADKIVVRYPFLQTLAGMMKSFIGLLFYLPSLGKTTLIDSGLATAKSGFFNEKRKVIQHHLKQLSTLPDSLASKPLGESEEEESGLDDPLP